ncbi:MAG: DUF3656 domain-containing protein, partial [Bryobacter sp.]|nr:DUF3656 domain-containing protein [Bryobacter sp.]
RKLKPYLEPAAPVARQRVNVVATASAGEPLRATWTLERRPDVTVTVASPEPLGAARNRAADAALIREQFERLGNTPYELGSLTFESKAEAFIPVSLLNQLRREAVEALAARQSEPCAIRVRPAAACAEALLSAVRPPEREEAAAPRVHLLVRTPEQLDAALALAPASITLDYLDLYGLKPSVEKVKESGIAVRVASPRILKPGEDRIVDFLLRLECPLLVRPAGLLDDLRARTAQPLTGDFSLNAANAISADRLLGLGLTRITPTHDLNGAQVAALAREVGGTRIEAIAYQHLPVFHTEHCVFCRFLSTGTTYKDCGRPCEEHRVELGDGNGRRHPVLADVGCRNPVFGADAQEASLHLESGLAAGIRDFRLEFAHESAAQVRTVTEAFAQALEGRRSFRSLNEMLRRLAPQSTTQGSLFIPLNHLTAQVLP